MHLTSKTVACCVVCAILASVSTGSRADDSSAGVALPSFRTSGMETLSRASVTLKGDNVKENLTLVVTHSTNLELALPRFGWYGDAETYPDRHFPELSATINGHGVALKSSFEVFVGEKNITGDVIESKIDPFVIADSPPIISPVPGGEAAFQKLVAEGAVTSSDAGDLAAWTAQRTIHIALPAAESPIVVSLRYKARPGFGAFSADKAVTATDSSRFCMDKGKMPSKLLLTRGRSVLRKEYTFPVTLNGKNTGVAQIRIEPGMAREHVVTVAAFCGSDGRLLVGGLPLEGHSRIDLDGNVHVLTLSPLP